MDGSEWQNDNELFSLLREKLFTAAVAMYWTQWGCGGSFFLPPFNLSGPIW